MCKHVWGASMWGPRVQRGLWVQGAGGERQCEQSDVVLGTEPLSDYSSFQIQVLIDLSYSTQEFSSCFL